MSAIELRRLADAIDIAVAAGRRSATAEL